MQDRQQFKNTASRTVRLRPLALLQVIDELIRRVGPDRSVHLCEPTRRVITFISVVCIYGNMSGPGEQGYAISMRWRRCVVRALFVSSCMRYNLDS